MSADLELRSPSHELLPGYIAAMRAGWSPSTTRDVTVEQLAAIEQDANEFLRDLERPGAPLTLNDGRVVERLPGRTFWMWDGAFCGAINIRYVPGTEGLPSHVSGHIGYAVVPWKQRRGYATRALALLLPRARAITCLPRVLITCDEDNVPSRKVIEANGGVFCGTEEDFDRPGVSKLQFWLSLPE